MLSGIRFKGYKSFTEKYSEISSFNNINIFIGRNNSGKSSVLDMIECIVTPERIKEYSDKNNDFILEACYTLLNDDIEEIFGKSYYRDDRENYKYVNKRFYSRIKTTAMPSGRLEYKFQVLSNENNNIDNRYIPRLEKLIGEKSVVFSRMYSFRKISAERNIIAEEDTNENVTLDSLGNGATNLVQVIVNNTEYNEKIIETELLNTLNNIISPDAKFTDANQGLDNTPYRATATRPNI